MMASTTVFAATVKTGSTYTAALHSFCAKRETYVISNTGVQKRDVSHSFLLSSVETSRRRSASNCWSLIRAISSSTATALVFYVAYSDFSEDLCA